MADSAKQHRMTGWLTGVIIFLGALLIVQSWMIFNMWKSSQQGVSRLGRHEQATWFCPPWLRDKATSPARQKEDRILVMQSAEELEDIHAQLNSIFNELTADFGNPMLPAGRVRDPAVAQSQLPRPASLLDEVRRLQLEMNSIFEGAFTEPAARALPTRFRTNWEDVGIAASMAFEDRGDHYTISVPLPGIDKSNIAVRLENQVLSISARQSSREGDSSDEYATGAFHNRVFETKIRFPAPVNTDQTQAEYRDDMLRVHAPKRMDAELLARAIEVQ